MLNTLRQRHILTEIFILIMSRTVNYKKVDIKELIEIKDYKSEWIQNYIVKEFIKETKDADS